VWQIVGAVKIEFVKRGAIMEKVQKKLEEAQHAVDNVSKRHRDIDRKPRGVESLSEQDCALLLECNGSFNQEDGDAQIKIAPIEPLRAWEVCLHCIGSGALSIGAVQIFLSLGSCVI
jgi:DNA anti-recombination protein RmuC